LDDVKGGNVTELVNGWLDYINNFEYVPNGMYFSSVPFILGLSACYLVGVLLLWLWMKDRPAYTLKGITLIHNVFLCAASLIMFIGLTTSLWGIAMRNRDDWEEVFFCDTHQKEVNKGPLYFWVYMFFFSKFYEWLDTALIILKKNKLGFLHVYHHWVTMLLVWICLETAIPVQWSAQILNTLVHVFMYYYYSMATLKINVWWKKYITQLQIVQFLLSNVAHLWAFRWHYGKNGNCSSFRDSWGNQLGMAIINSYLLLFIQFYFATYKKQPSSTTTPAGRDKKKAD